MPERHASTATLPQPGPGTEPGTEPEGFGEGSGKGFGEADAESGPAQARRVRVLLPLPLTGPYDYLAPPGSALPPGSVVRVPLAQRELAGVVWDGTPESDTASDSDSHSDPDSDSGRAAHKTVPLARLRPILEVLDVPPLTPVARRFLAWVADYTMAAPGAVLRMALSSPSALEPPKPVTLYQRCGTTISEGPPEDLRLTPARKRVLSVLDDGPARSLADLAASAGVGSSVVKGLVAAGVLETVEVVREARFEAPDAGRAGPHLSGRQAAAAEALRAAVRAAAQEEAGAFSVTLLDGVTGSGKTEVYFEAIAEAVAAGRQALVLLPEIALSAQWLERFEQRFGVAPALWHSDLTSAQRRATWRAVAQGRAPVVVGARSALFLPYRDLGLLVVDEEHESAFKQEDGVTYHARDMAVVRAQLGGIPAVLVSATPSLESLNNVRAGRYRALHLPERHGGAVLPEVGLVDLRQDRPAKLEGLGPGWLSAALRRAIAETLEAGEQVLLFLNRRGYAPLTLCRACGHRLQCPNCTAWLVEHRLSGRLQCHHCGHAARLPQACPACGAEGTLTACGPGVERLAEEARVLFPRARQALMTSDTLVGPDSAAALVRAVQAGDVNLLIGTQIVAKGHHFPQLTLVGVVDADLGLYGGDLRAAERTYQLLHQVAGRAGRAERRGRVLLQTAEPDHPVMQALAAPVVEGAGHDEQGRDRFFAAEAAAREAAGLPPFGRLAALILSGPDAQQLDATCRALARTAPHVPEVTVLGPAPAPLAVLRGRHRRRFLVKAPRGFRLQALLRAWLAGTKIPNAVRLQVDIDPYSFL